MEETEREERLPAVSGQGGKAASEPERERTDRGGLRRLLRALLGGGLLRGLLAFLRERAAPWLFSGRRDAGELAEPGAEKGERFFPPE